MANEKQKRKEKERERERGGERLNKGQMKKEGFVGRNVSNRVINVPIVSSLLVSLSALVLIQALSVARYTVALHKKNSIQAYPMR